ncbi:aminotransferase class I/II-fold pyridoxal phosphate-dependent enzyme [Aliiroseovarius crassostreae]|uniref:pyridoxal phosphate-dependent aminotransferase n=1 Tax=Aliiroseovarius crassostreae TaxID=154981 RepID=UPI0021AF4299|nr:aminotransferase class I/II-fold pyridoxal phosphate-dependent enzyme [Aliiroseovarius crassostreae]UWQ12423.1 aminotransferase class I/II-fold pyridoxal phosphate-dependent enzyme [Aliiroseovarius crassostreae]
MRISTRIAGILDGGDDGWGVFYRARAMVEAGEQVTELTIGEPDQATDPSILHAMYQAALNGHTGYAAIPGTNALRDAVAARVQTRTGVPTGRENVMITPGGQAGLFAAHMAACDEGDRALHLDPHYATYPGTIRAVGAQAVPIATHADNGFQPRAEDIRAQARGARSLLINSPNNPTGVLYTRATLEGISEACHDEDLWLISDEVYDTQVWQGEHLSPRALPGMAERTLVVGSMSKSHAMTGSRIGWIIGPEQAIGHLETLAINTTYGVAGFVQDAALFALDQGEAFEARIAEPFRRRREAALALIKGQDLVRVVPADGTMYLMLDIRATGLSGKEFAEALLTSKRIAVMPGESFGTAAAGHIRVAMTVEDHRLQSALMDILQFAQTCKKE